MPKSIWRRVVLRNCVIVGYYMIITTTTTIIIIMCMHIYIYIYIYTHIYIYIYIYEYIYIYIYICLPPACIVPCRVVSHRVLFDDSGRDIGPVRHHLGAHQPLAFAADIMFITLIVCYYCSIPCMSLRVYYLQLVVVLHYNTL